MFKLVVIFAIVAVATAAPGLHSSPLYSTLVGEKTIESHGNAVVHASAPVVHETYVAAPVVHKTYAPAPVVHTYAAAPIVHHSYAPAPVVYAPLHSTKTVSHYGHNVVSHGGPALSHVAYAAPAYYH